MFLQGSDPNPDMNDYIELKTVKKSNPGLPPYRAGELFPKWYMQSYLLGVGVLQVGYRNFKNHVFKISRLPVNHVLLDAQRYSPSFKPAADFGRAHAILSALFAYFRDIGPSVSAQDMFVLRVDTNRDVWITSPIDSSNPVA